MIKVLIADDSGIMRTSLKTIIEQDQEIEVLATARDGKEAFQLCQEHQPDIVLMDIRMPVCDGVESTKLIKENFKNIMVIILTTFEDEEYISRAILNGADGYILKNINDEDLINIIKSTNKGYSVIQKNVFNTVKTGYSSVNINKKSKINHRLVGKLTDREKEIIKNMAEGKSYGEIAEILGFAEGTIKNITSDILEKLALKDRTQIVIFAMKNDLV